MKHTQSLLRGTTAGILLLGATANAQITFNPGSTVATGQRPDAVAFGDFDLDGDQDFAVSTGPQGGNLDAVEFYSNDGAGNFSLSLAVLTGNNTSPGALVARDFSGNGAADVAVALHNSNTVLMLMNDGLGGFTMGASASTGGDPRSLGAGDVDADGDLDVVSSNRNSNSVTVLLNSGAGTLTPAGTTTVGADLRAVVVADFNADGMGDVAVSSHDSRQVAVFLSTGGGAMGAPALLSVGANRRPEGITAGDFNGDGQIDLAAATSLNNDSWATIFTNAGGTFGAPQHFAFLGIDADSIVSADFDLDGDLDLATSNQTSNNVSILSNLAGGTFGSPTLVATGTRPGGIAAGDIDGDGDADLATANRDSNNVSVLTNAGGGNAWTNYCQTAPNSVGAGAIMGASGTTSVQANNFFLEVSNAVPNTVGMFAYSNQQGLLPVGNGFLCLSGSFFRLGPPTAASAGGTNSRRLNFTLGNPSGGAGQILGGSTWNFQYWYRDAAAGGQGFNFSDGLSVMFAQ